MLPVLNERRVSTARGQEGMVIDGVLFADTLGPVYVIDACFFADVLSFDSPCHDLEADWNGSILYLVK